MIIRYQDILKIVNFLNLILSLNIKGIGFIQQPYNPSLPKVLLRVLRARFKIRDHQNMVGNIIATQVSFFATSGRIFITPLRP